jgi:hypothetical protein
MHAHALALAQSQAQLDVLRLHLLVRLAQRLAVLHALWERMSSGCNQNGCTTYTKATIQGLKITT